MTGICNMLRLIIIAVVFTTAIADYCNLQSCKRKGVHTMCKYKSTLGSQCVNAKQRGLTNNEKIRIVNKHNELRRKVARGQETRGAPGPQPAAVSMPDLTWDNELEMIAQKWADQCSFGHDQCRDVDRFQVGQNAGITMHSAENNSPVEDTVQRWYNEVAKLDNKQVNNFNPPNFKDVGHYTQVVWAGTTKIGCGRIKFRGSGWNNQLLYCNYGPAGNMRGAKIYQRK